MDAEKHKKYQNPFYTDEQVENLQKTIDDVNEALRPLRESVERAMTKFVEAVSKIKVDLS
mgnify:CR=1 FL=1